MVANSFDIYAWRARVTPVFLVLLPLTIASAVWLPDFVLIGRLAGIVLIPFGVAMLMAQIGRDLGKRRQPHLWQQWGGAPTTQLLRHRNTKANPILRGRYHKKLRELELDLSIPTPEEEDHDPERADHAYDTCVQYLIAQTRDRKRFPLLFKENVNYGFRRNLWGMKPLGLVFAALGLAACGFYAWLYWDIFRLISVEATIGGIFNFGFLLFWLFWVTPDWVRIVGDAYAERLMETCEHLQWRG